MSALSGLGGMVEKLPGAGRLAFRQDKALARHFAGVVISREDFDAYRANGTLKSTFGSASRINRRYYSFGVPMEQGVGECALDILRHMQAGGVTVDLTKSENKAAVRRLSAYVRSVASQNFWVPEIPNPYGTHPDIVATVSKWREALAKREAVPA